MRNRARLLPSLFVLLTSCGGDAVAPGGEAPGEGALEGDQGLEALLAEDAAGDGKDDLASGRIWRTTTTGCGATIAEDFSTGKFTVHRFAFTASAGRLEASLTATGGTWSPEVVLAPAGGAAARGAESGDDRLASIELAERTQVYIYVTDTPNLDRAGTTPITRSATYRLSLRCPPPEPPPPPPPGTGEVHAGLTLGALQIPRVGLQNPTLRRALGVSTEPYGDVVTIEGKRYVRGRSSWFGGPRDTGVTASETGAITGERLRSLNSPLAPDAGTLAARAKDYYFVAMRFDYTPGIAAWRDARILVRNPRTGASVVVRAVDWGPNTRTGRTVDLSPQALADLRATTDDLLDVAFAAPGTPLGVVR